MQRLQVNEINAVAMLRRGVPPSDPELAALLFQIEADRRGVEFATDRQIASIYWWLLWASLIAAVASVLSVLLLLRR